MHPYSTISTPPIATFNVNSTSNTTTTSGSDALISGMTITPIAGTYFVLFTSSIQQNIAGDSITVTIYSGGNPDTTSTLTFAPFAGGTLTAGQSSCPCSTQSVVTVNGSQSIEAHWHVSGGTATCFQRKLSIMKIG